MVAATDIQPCGDRPLKYSVIMVRCGSRWLFCRKRGRDTWESAGGHIEQGETPLQGALRELYEETGIVTQSLVEVFDYYAEDTVDATSAWGRVFLCVCDAVPDAPPAEFEMAETRLFDGVPEGMTYSGIVRVLFPEIIKFSEQFMEV